MPGRIERPLKQHQASTVFLRCPTPQWPLVSTGKVTEFRNAVGNAPRLFKVPLPTLAVVYRRQTSHRTASYRNGDRTTGAFDYRLMLLEEIRQEALGTITDEGLGRAGYTGEDAFARFRRDWMIADKRRFQPLKVVVVYTVRPVQPGDLTAVGAALVSHLYGGYVEEAQERPRTVQAQRGPAQGARHDRGAVAARGR